MAKEYVPNQLIFLKNETCGLNDPAAYHSFNLKN